MITIRGHFIVLGQTPVFLIPPQHNLRVSDLSRYSRGSPGESPGQDRGYALRDSSRTFRGVVARAPGVGGGRTRERLSHASDRLAGGGRGSCRAILGLAGGGPGGTESTQS